MYPLHQIWSSVKWRSVTIFLFVYLNHSRQSVGKGTVSMFFSAVLVLCTLPESGQGKVVILIFSHLLCLRICDAQGETDTLKRAWCVCDICSYVTQFVFTDAYPLSLLEPQNSVLQLHKWWVGRLCLPQLGALVLKLKVMRRDWAESLTTLLCIHWYSGSLKIRFFFLSMLCRLLSLSWDFKYDVDPSIN